MCIYYDFCRSLARLYTSKRSRERKRESARLREGGREGEEEREHKLLR
jgi:hypothetical protein